MKQISARQLLSLSAVVGLPAIVFLLKGVGHGLASFIWPFVLILWPAAAIVLLILIPIAAVQMFKSPGPKRDKVAVLGVAALSCALFIAAWILV